jgi:alpha-ketoglutarate-dependent taurine dioxygenase
MVRVMNVRLGAAGQGTMGQPSFEITPIKEHIGAEITGVDLTLPVDAATRRALYDAVVDHVAVVIRDQTFEPQTFAAAAELFGTLMADQIKTNLVDGLPMVSILDNFHKDSKGAQAIVHKNGTWHTDHTNKEIPPCFTFLHAVEIPEQGGGTSAVNMNAAYEALPSETRAKLDKMKTANTRVSSARLAIANPDSVAEQDQLGEPLMIHPLVRTHPERGTKAIWFHKGKTETIDDMDPYETQDFLAELLEDIIKPEFTYTHNWRRGDLLIIDNRSAMHKAGSDYDPSQQRKLYRTMTLGERPY